MIIFCPHSSLTQRHERPESFPHLPCGCPRASARACHNLPQMAYGEAVDTREFPRPALLQRAAAGSQAWRISTIRIILAMNCARYTTLCTVASVAYIAIRLMHHVSHTRESPCSSLPLHFLALNPFQASNNSRYVMPSAGASTRLTKLSARLSILYNSVANACNFAQIHT